MALTHLSLAEPKLATSANASSPLNFARVLVTDAIQNLQNNDINAALTHLSLANQQLEEMNITASPSSVGKEDANITGKSTQEFSAYENSSFGIRLQYPANWEKFESAIIRFDSQSKDSTVGIFPIANLENSPFPTFAKENPQFLLKVFAETYLLWAASNSSDFKLLESNTTTFGGDTNPAHKIIFIAEPLSTANLTIAGYQRALVEAVFAIKDDNVYSVFTAVNMSSRSDAEGEQKYSEYLEVPERIINSFEIIGPPKITEPTLPQKGTPVRMSRAPSYEFENPNYGIKLTVYGEWNDYHPEGPTSDCSFEIVRFQNSTLGGSKPLELFICAEDVYDETLSLDDIFNRRIGAKDLDMMKSNQYGETLITYGPETALSGNPAYELRWTNDTLRTTELGTIVTNTTLGSGEPGLTSRIKLYTVTFRSDPESFEQNCAVAQKMFESLKITALGASNEESGSGPAFICNQNGGSNPISEPVSEYYCTSSGCGYYKNGTCLDCDTDNNGISDEMYDPREPAMEGCDDPTLVCDDPTFSILPGEILRPTFTLNATGFSIADIPVAPGSQK